MAIVYAAQMEHMSLDQMQETHESEIQLINDIDNIATDLEMGRGDKEELEKKLDEYIEHVKEHFEKEEELMEEYEFHAYEMHAMAHEMFIMDLNYATMHWKRNGDLKKIVTFVRKVPEWLIMHVNTVDAPTAEFLAKRIG